ncbi:MAG: hypothetical protein GWP10_10910 [Nitrospiraceae bacterium]|nr:hypothetical protein [Nitrospiraceae bacterium]
MIEFKNNVLTVIDKGIKFEFKFISFPHEAITFNGNGFADSGTLRYVVRGKEKVLDLNPAIVTLSFDLKNLLHYPVSLLS